MSTKWGFVEVCWYQPFRCSAEGLIPTQFVSSSLAVLWQLSNVNINSSCCLCFMIVGVAVILCSVYHTATCTCMVECPYTSLLRLRAPSSCIHLLQFTYRIHALETHSLTGRAMSIVIQHITIFQPYSWICNFYECIQGIYYVRTCIKYIHTCSIIIYTWHHYHSHRYYICIMHNSRQCSLLYILCITLISMHTISTKYLGFQEFTALHQRQFLFPNITP